MHVALAKARFQLGAAQLLHVSAVGAAQNVKVRLALIENAETVFKASLLAKAFRRHFLHGGQEDIRDPRQVHRFVDELARLPAVRHSRGVHPAESLLGVIFHHRFVKRRPLAALLPMHQRDLAEVGVKREHFVILVVRLPLYLLSAAARRRNILKHRAVRSAFYVDIFPAHDVPLSQVSFD